MPTVPKYAKLICECGDECKAFDCSTCGTPLKMLAPKPGNEISHLWDCEPCGTRFGITPVWGEEEHEEVLGITTCAECGGRFYQCRRPDYLCGLCRPYEEPVGTDPERPEPEPISDLTRDLYDAIDALCVGL